MPVRKSLRLQVFLVVALAASCLVCNTCLTIGEFAKGPKYLKVLLSPNRFQRALENRGNKHILLPGMGTWYPGNTGALKVVGLSGEADELVDTIAKFCTGSRSFEFLLPRSAVGTLLGPDGSNLEEFRKEHKEGVSQGAQRRSFFGGDVIEEFRKEHKEAIPTMEVNIDSEAEHSVFTGSAAEAKVSVSKASKGAVKAVAKWIMDNQDVQDELSRSLGCGYESDADTLDSEILVKLSPECKSKLLQSRGKSIKQMRQEYFVKASIDEDYNDVTISGLVGDVSAFHRHLLQLERALALAPKPQSAE